MSTIRIATGVTACAITLFYCACTEKPSRQGGSLSYERSIEGHSVTYTFTGEKPRVVVTKPADVTYVHRQIPAESASRVLARLGLPAPGSDGTNAGLFVAMKDGFPGGQGMNEYVFSNFPGGTLYLTVGPATNKAVRESVPVESLKVVQAQP